MKSYLILFLIQTVVGNRFLKFRPSSDYGDGNSDICKRLWAPGHRCVYDKERRKAPVKVKIEECAAGSYSNTKESFDKTRCEWCQPGQWQVSSGQTNCYGTPCLDGTYDNTPPNQQGSCLSCPLHHYSNSRVGTYECDICVGSTNNKDHTDCLTPSCLNGTYYFLGKCLPCPAGTHPHSDHHYCVPCSKNSWSFQNSSECTQISVPRFTRPPRHPDKTQPFQSTSHILFFSSYYGGPIWTSIICIVVLIIVCFLDTTLNRCLKFIYIIFPTSLLISFLTTDKGDFYDERYALGMCLFILVWTLSTVYHRVKKNKSETNI